MSVEHKTEKAKRTKKAKRIKKAKRTKDKRSKKQLRRIKKDFDDDYDNLESLRFRLRNTSEFSKSNNAMDSFLYQFESGSKILSFQQIQCLAVGFIRIHCHNSDPKNTDFSTSIPLNEIVKYSQFGHSNWLSLQNYNPFTIEQRKYCYHCFASNINDKNKSFLICSRCKTAKYCDANCQKNNWKFHKHSCKSVQKRKEIQDVIHTLSAGKCARELKKQHQNATFSFHTICYLKRIQYLLETHQCRNANTIGYHLHAMTPKPTRFCPISMDYYTALFSCPGIPEFIFNASLTRISRRNFYNKFGFPPNWDKFTGVECDFDDDSDAEQPFEEDTFDHCEFKGLDAYQMSFYIVNILFGATRSYAVEVANESFVVLSTRRLFEWYSNPDIIDDCGDALGNLSEHILSLMDVLKDNQFVDSPNFGIQFMWKNFILQTSFLDCVFKEYLELAHNRSSPLKILQFVADHMQHEYIWNDKRDGSYFLVLWSWALLNLSSYDYDDTGMHQETRMCRKAINVALGCDGNGVDRAKITKYVEYVIRFQCNVYFRDEKELNAKLEMFKFRPFFGFQFSPYSDAPFWYFVYFYYLQRDDLEDDLQLFDVGKPCIVEAAYSQWKSVNSNHNSEIYKTCLKASMNKAEYMDWMGIKQRMADR